MFIGRYGEMWERQYWGRNSITKGVGVCVCMRVRGIDIGQKFRLGEKLTFLHGKLQESEIFRNISWFLQ